MLLLEQWLRSWAGSPEPVDSWQPNNAGLIPRRGRGQKDGAAWAREEGRAEARGPRWAGRMTQWAGEPPGRAGEALLLKSLVPALLILAPGN